MSILKVLKANSENARRFVTRLARDFPREHPEFLGFLAIWQGVKEAVWPLGVPAIIVIGMAGGVFTPTESASIAEAPSPVASEPLPEPAPEKVAESSPVAAEEKPAKAAAAG